MKKLNFLFLSAIALVSVTSCSKNEDDDKTASIVGKWEFSKVRAVIAGGTDSGEYAYPAGLSTASKQCGANDLLNFTSATDATYVDSYLTDTSDANSCTAETIPFKYTLSGKTLTVTGIYNDPVDFTVTSLTETELRLTATFGTETDTWILVRK